MISKYEGASVNHIMIWEKCCSDRARECTGQRYGIFKEHDKNQGGWEQ
jgi:hypothetical protein